MNLAVDRFRLIAAFVGLALLVACSVSGSDNREFFGKTKPPKRQVLRYVTGTEPQSIDPQIPISQSDYRIVMALFEGLVEYHPETMEPIPAIAERWEANSDSSEFVFHLRRNARWSNGDPITAHDFVYTFRRGLSPELAAINASLASYIKYAQSYNASGLFVRDPTTGEFLLEKDFAVNQVATDSSAHLPPRQSSAVGASSSGSGAAVRSASGQSSPPPTSSASAISETAFQWFIRSPMRLVLPGTERARTKELEKNQKLKTALVGKEFVPVKAEDIGVAAADDYTLRITLTQSAPFFISMLPSPFFRLAPRKAIEEHGSAWTQPENIITCGPFKLQTWKPYNEIVVVRDPLYWDAAIVKLDRISFYAIVENTTVMNLYKAGEVDAVYNHAVPVGWLDQMRSLKDYMDAPELGISYYLMNTTKPPMNDKRVRRAFNMAIDKAALAAMLRTTKPLTAFTPEGLFPSYPQPEGDSFNPAQAKQLLAQAGYRNAAGDFDANKFPINQVEMIYQTHATNRTIAEFLQSQWNRNLGITVTLRSMESKTFNGMRDNLEYKGFARGGFAGDYMDPFTFLNIFYTPNNGSGSGWSDPQYDRMIDTANRTLDPQQRYQLLAKAEAYLLEEQPMIPLQTYATNWMKKPYVKEMYPNPGTMHAWKFVYIEHDPAKWDRTMP